ncbi:MAG: acyl--CoA ligase, partial [Mycobacterium sp.]|nr:acyl--CoA ligase [Mycobacterium sp.]
MSAGGLDTVGSPAFTDEESMRYRAAGWWSDSTLSDAVRRNAEHSPDRCAYADDPGAALTWRAFDCSADALAEQLAGVGVEPGDRVAVWHGDCAAIHVLFVAIERCGAVVVGIGARAGSREVTAILRNSQPKLLISDEQRSDAAVQAATGVAAQLAAPSLVLTHDADFPRLNTDTKPRALSVESQRGPDDVFLINSTSGTTGLPKCVVHTQNRWYYFHQKAVANGRLTSDDIFLPAIPTPFGFGLWTSHTTPIYLGATAAILTRFTPQATCEAIARHKVTILCCVSTQLTMLMADRACRDYDLSSLRVVFTGGEALPYRPAAEFEELTGAKILQFYG